MLGPGQLLSQLEELRTPLVQLPLQPIQLGTLILHTSERNLKRHRRPSWENVRSDEGRKHRRGRILSRIQDSAHQRDVPRRSHGLWPEA
jgi:hypothetical protein